MAYDPRKLGARCDDCWLREQREGEPVPSELNPQARILAVGEAPGENEVEQGRPFVGGSGDEAMRAFGAIGLGRYDLSWANVVECRPPRNDMRKLLHDLQKVNKARADKKLPPLPSPQACCRPRLLTQLQQYKDIITLGQSGLRAITGGESSIMAMRGGPLQGVLGPDGRFDTTDGPVPGRHFVRVMPVLHPAFVMRMRRWQHVFQSDIAKAWRLFTGRLNWVEPDINVAPTLAQLRAFLAQPVPFIAFDYETDGIEPMMAKVRCLGFGTKDAAIVVPFLSIDGHTALMSTADAEDFKQETAEWMRGKRLKVGHNAGYYDRIIAKRQLGVDPKPLLDTVLFSRANASELPHTLAFEGSMKTDVTAWKAEHTATEAQTDYQLHYYCGTDAVVNARIVEPLQQSVEARGQTSVAYFDHKVQWLCVGMKEQGLFINEKKRAEWDAKLRVESIAFRKAVRELAGKSDFNPNSFKQVGELLFTDWALAVPPKGFTELGDPSTSDDNLRKLLVAGGVPKRAKDFILALRKFRRRVKWRGTYVRKLVPHWEVVPDDDLSEDEDSLRRLEEAREAGASRAELLESAVTRKYGVVLGDGRLHPNWNAHTVVSGRLASSDPNVQNWPPKLRDMVEAAPGHVLVGADMDQIELRFASAIAGARAYLKVFAEKGDPHTMAALMMSGAIGKKQYEAAVAKYGLKKAKEDADWGQIRTFAKRFQYACLYGATLATVHDTIVSTEEEDGGLPYLNLARRETRNSYEGWLAGNPEFALWWEEEVKLWRRDGFLTDPTIGRRRDFLDGEDRNEILNFRCQAGASALVHMASIELCVGADAPLRFGRWGPGTGLIQQGHDALVFEVPEDKGEWAKGLVQEAMTRRIPGMDMLFSAEAKVGKRWTDLK